MKLVLEGMRLKASIHLVGRKISFLRDYNNR
jgi:hypothetical protein